MQAFLAIEDVGDTLEAVEVLISKHENFEKSLTAQEEKFKALEEMASFMMGTEHYAATEAHLKKEEVSILIDKTSCYFEVFRLTANNLS